MLSLSLYYHHYQKIKTMSLNVTQKNPCFCCVSLLFNLIIIIIQNGLSVFMRLIDLQFSWKHFCYNTISMYHYTIIKFYIRFFKHLWNKQQVHLAFFHRHINCLFLSFELLFDLRIKKNSDDNCASLTNEKKLSLQKLFEIRIL